MSTARRSWMITCTGICAFVVLTAYLPHAEPRASSAVEEALAWIDDIPAHRIVTDGYVDTETPSLLTPEGQQRMLPAALLEYYTRAWRTFLEQPDLTGLQREARHYKIGHEIDGEVLVVVIQGLLLPRLAGNTADDYLRVSVGPSMRLRYSLVSSELLEQILLR